LLSMYSRAVNKNQYCSFAQRVFSETPNLSYGITKWGTGGNLHYLCLDFQYQYCADALEEKSKLLEKMLLDCGGSERWAHGGGEVPYISEIFSKLGFMAEADQAYVVRELLRNAKIKKEYGPYMCLHMAYVEYHLEDMGKARNWLLDYSKIIDSEKMKKDEKIMKLINDGFGKPDWNDDTKVKEMKWLLDPYGSWFSN